jgi:hypothetical protein
MNWRVSMAVISAPLSDHALLDVHQQALRWPHG